MISIATFIAINVRTGDDNGNGDELSIRNLKTALVYLVLVRRATKKNANVYTKCLDGATGTAPVDGANDVHVS